LVLTNVNKNSYNDATTAILKTDAWATIATATFIWDVATFSLQILDSWTYYRIETYKWWGSANFKIISSFSLLDAWAISYVNWSQNWSNVTNWENIDSIECLTLNEITLAWSITLTEWTKYHIVIYQGTYWSETVDGSNYYKIGYDIKNTTTRYWLRYDWAAWSDEFAGAEITDVNNRPMSSNGVVTTSQWFRIYTNKSLFLKTVTLRTSVTATEVYLKSDAWLLLATGIVSGLVAEFSWYRLDLNTYYRIEAGNDWASYTRYYDVTTSFPINRTNLNYIVGSVDWVDSSWDSFNIVSIDTSEPLAKYWRIYTQSDLFTDELLSLTDARYTYKLPDYPRIAVDDYAIWNLVKYDFAWISKRLNWLTKDSEYYISDTPWALSLSAWTNSKKIGKAVWEDELFLYDFLSPNLA
jgi:hypothetical protein